MIDLTIAKNMVVKYTIIPAVAIFLLGLLIEIIIEGHRIEKELKK